MKFLFVFLLPLSLLAWNNGQGVTPPMGWNPYNYFGLSFNETIVMESAQALISSGLAALGYVYVNLDNGWQNQTRAENGSLYWNPEKFPHGIPYLADYVHGLGLKFGIYSGAGAMSYDGLPGSLGHEDTDADNFAAWQVDYLKYDYFKDNFTVGVPDRFRRMYDALIQCNRSMYYSNSGGGISLPWLWGPPILNSWRITLDINDHWSSIPRLDKFMTIAWPYGHPSGWNDADMLEVGNGGMTFNEYQTHFALWAFWKSPLLIGTDVRNMSNETLSILSNTEIIAVNQDQLGKPAGRVFYSLDLNQEIWGCEIVDGYAAILFNVGDNDNQTIVAKFEYFGLEGAYYVRDLYAHEDLGVFEDNFTAVVTPHSVRVIKLTQEI